MSTLLFEATSYWDKSTMSPGDSPTPDQWDELKTIVKSLNEKYTTVKGCFRHPDIVQKIAVGLFNGFVDIQIIPSQTCQCHEMMVELVKLRNLESLALNDGKPYH